MAVSIVMLEEWTTVEDRREKRDLCEERLAPGPSRR